MKNLKLSTLLSAIALIVISFSCKKEVTTTNGIILYMAPPDNCNDYIIKTDDGAFYKPSSLNNDFKVDSLLVEFSFKTSDLTHSCGFGGLQLEKM